MTIDEFINLYGIRTPRLMVMNLLHSKEVNTDNGADEETRSVCVMLDQLTHALEQYAKNNLNH